MIEPQFVEFIPETLKDGVLYVSHKYRTATHRCCCGCGEDVVTPLGPTDWTLQIVGGTATLYPSIGNWSFACRSHYWIRSGKVVWAPSMTKQQIESGRARDQRIRDAHFTAVNRQKEPTPTIAPRHQTAPVQHSPDWLDEAGKFLKKLFRL